MRQVHESFGHFKSSASLDSLRIRYWWPGMASDYKEYVKSCPDCALVDGNRLGKPTLLPLQDPGVPFHTWHLDFLQDLPETTNSNTQILVAVDRSTRLVKAVACTSRSTVTVLHFLEDLIHTYGCPSVLIHDRALCFLSAEFKSYCAKQNIQTLPSSSYHPQTNGMVERVNQELKRMLVKLCQSDHYLWDRFLAMVVFNLNIRKHVTTGYSPFSLCYGFEPKLPTDITPIRLWNFSHEQDRHTFMTRELDLLGCHRAAAFHRSQRQARLLTERSSNPQFPVFQVGEYVQRKIKRTKDQVTPSFGFKWAGPFVIDRVNQNGSYYLKRANGEVESHPTNAVDLIPYQPSRGGVMSWRHLNQGNALSKD
jgi:transposase InsO family protein